MTSSNLRAVTGGRRVLDTRLLARVCVLCLIASSLLWAATTTSSAVVSVTATVETVPAHGTGDADDDAAIWIHPTDSSLSTVIGTDKSTDGHGLVVYDLSGRELYYYPDGRMNNVDVRYNFPLGGSTVSLVGVSNRSRSLDFYRVNPSDRSLTKVGSIVPGTDIKTPRGFALYHSPITNKFYAFVTDSGKIEQWELDGTSGTVTGQLARKWTLGGVTEGLVVDDEYARLYVAQEDVGGIWRFGAEPSASTAGARVVSTIENGGDIVQDIKGITIYYAANGGGYLLAASQGSSRFHVYDRDTNLPLGSFQIVAGNGIDKVTGMDGIDVTNFGVGGPFPQGFFVTQDHANDTGNQSFKLVPWQSIASAFSPPLLVDTTWDPRLVGVTQPAIVDTTIVSAPTNPTATGSAQFAFTSTSPTATFECALDNTTFASCASPTSFADLPDGSHTFAVRATDSGATDPTPAVFFWTVDTIAPDTTITSSPPVTSTSASASFSFSANDSSSTFLCSLDMAAPSSCGGTTSYSGLSDGQHSFTVAAIDQAGNVDGTPASWSWTIDTSSNPPLSQIVRASVSSTANVTASTTLTVAKPSGTIAGDVLVACVATNGANISAGGVPTGWSSIASVTGASNPRVFGYYKVATQSEPADYRWTLASSVTSGGGIARYAGSTGLDGSGTTAFSTLATTSATIPGPTTLSSGAMLVGCLAINSSSTTTTITTPTGMTEAWDIGGKRHEVTDALQAVPGTGASRTWTFSSSRSWAGWMVPLRPSG